jgi:hypothetical protein
MVATFRARIQTVADLCCGAFEHSKRTDDWHWHALARPSNLEVLDGALRLSTPVPAAQNITRELDRHTILAATGK